ncbi:MAG: AbrB/MazE/SpoVT family DNA-binding domain-containing protein [Chloroflexi bacterium]|nr:AbrB/MazE/SpoVT family DNA-binding domain-containing protein [Chloroflexota bacterium]MCL5076159.1 AbrB/MazE/SpoVT family DNA-binding domain-containing protein [Chloroflexota bacterium]
MKQRQPMTKIVRPLRGGQITIPAEFRRELGINEQSYLQITLLQGELRIKPARVTAELQGSAWLKELYQYFAPARQEAARYSEEEINTDIDAAVKEVRRKRAPSSL